MPVRVSRQGAARRGDRRKLAASARDALRALGLAQAELSVVLCDDHFIQGLNAEWRQREEATDVLSFPQDGPEGPVLGDVVISVETGARQAEGLGHSLQHELTVLLIHGLCHLLGHDHQQPEQAQQMATLEEQLLGSRGLILR